MASSAANGAKNLCWNHSKSISNPSGYVRGIHLHCYGYVLIRIVIWLNNHYQANVIRRRADAYSVMSTAPIPRSWFMGKSSDGYYVSYAYIRKGTLGKGTFGIWVLTWLHSSNSCVHSTIVILACHNPVRTVPRKHPEKLVRRKKRRRRTLYPQHRVMRGAWWWWLISSNSMLICN